MSAPTNQYTVNYYPVNNSGYEMWSHYNGAQYQADMQKAKSLGFNTLRVFLAATTGIFDFSSPTAAELANLTDFYKRSKTVGIKLHLTLFDYWGSYGYISGSQTWIAAMFRALPDTANIAVIEIQNETRYALTTTYTGGFDSGWPAGVKQYSQVGQVAIVWAQSITGYIRSVAPGVPVTASTSYGTADLSAYLAAVKGTSAAPSWYDWHCYEASSSVPYSSLQTVVSIIGNPAMLYIGETGLTSEASGSQGTLQAQQAQSDYIQAVRWSCAQLGLPEPGPWILFDLNSSAQFSGGQSFGLFDTSGNVKLSGALYQATPPGTIVPAISLNGNMEGCQPDTNGNGLPVRWSLYKGNTDIQPVSAAIDTATTYQGNATVLLTGSGATSANDNPPALQSLPATLPVVIPGQVYTFSCAIKATGSYHSGGWPALEISWYGSSGNYISSTSGPPLTLTSTFARYSLNSTAPPASAYAALFVNVGHNSGKIWVGGAVWAGPS